MMPFVRKHIAALAGVFILWFGYGHLSEPTAAAAEKMKLQPIGPRYLAVRPAEQPVPSLEDPYRFTVSEAEPGEEGSTAAGPPDDEEEMNLRSPSASAEDGAGTSPPPGSRPGDADSAGAPRAANPNGTPAGGSGKLPNPNRASSGGSGKLPNPNSKKSAGSGRLPNPNGGAGSVSGSRGSSWARKDVPPVFVIDAGPADLPAMPGPVRLWLDAVLDVPEGGSARISGVRAEIGDTVVGLDASAPPVLLAIDGMTVTVRYRTVDYTLAVDAPVLVIQPRPAEESVEPTAGAGG
jgi:hypothetical protein